MGIPVWDRLKGSPMKTIQASCMAALTLCLASVALADDLQTVGDSDSLGFSARRLERITSWFEAQTKKGDPSVLSWLSHGALRPTRQYVRNFCFQTRLAHHWQQGD